MRSAANRSESGISRRALARITSAVGRPFRSGLGNLLRAYARAARRKSSWTRAFEWSHVRPPLGACGARLGLSSLSGKSHWRISSGSFWRARRGGVVRKKGTDVVPRPGPKAFSDLTNIGIDLRPLDRRTEG